MTIEAFGEANQPPPARVAETPAVEVGLEVSPEVATEAPSGQDSCGERLRALVRAETAGLVGKVDADLSEVETNVTAALSEAFAPFGFAAEWRADRSRVLDELGTLFGVMRIEPRRPGE